MLHLTKLNIYLKWLEENELREETASHYSQCHICLSFAGDGEIYYKDRQVSQICIKIVYSNVYFCLQSNGNCLTVCVTLKVLSDLCEESY